MQQILHISPLTKTGFLHFPSSNFIFFTNLETPIWNHAFKQKPKNHQSSLRSSFHKSRNTHLESCIQTETQE
ncbi:hypothetical protein L1987_12347 [Smallanthus sonchifolius]|uniref:Uncharacterized protein n=1 Tax=Smallanthus sonchifolius TaxID=185202 RepID=A0ACB9JEE3_9ASTR|nr:hypothetical protein L1987_12347 [Smallanthus sonchifolius]